MFVVDHESRSDDSRGGARAAVFDGSDWGDNINPRFRSRLSAVRCTGG